MHHHGSHSLSPPRLGSRSPSNSFPPSHERSASVGGGNGHGLSSGSGGGGGGPFGSTSGNGAGQNPSSTTPRFATGSLSDDYRSRGPMRHPQLHSTYLPIPDSDEPFEIFSDGFFFLPSAPNPSSSNASIVITPIFASSPYSSSSSSSPSTPSHDLASTPATSNYHNSPHFTPSQLSPDSTTSPEHRSIISPDVMLAPYSHHPHPHGVHNSLLPGVLMSSSSPSSPACKMSEYPM